MQLCRFYLLPKLHKLILSWREICSSPCWLTYIVSIFIDALLQPLMQQIPTYIKNSSNIVKDLTYMQFPAECILLESDVEALYPSIVINDGLHALNSFLLDLNWNSTTIHVVVKLTEWVLKNNYLQFNNETYLQTVGTAMGTPLANTYSTIFMHKLENKALHLCHAISLPPPLYLIRYLDDIFGIFSNELHAHLFMYYLKTIYPLSIRFTHKISTSKAVILDLEIYKPNNFEQKHYLYTNLYQKPLNKYLYLPPISSHPQHVFSNLVTNSLTRINNTCTTKSHYKTHKRCLYQRLIARGFSCTFLRPLFKKRFLRNIFKFNCTNSSHNEKSTNNPYSDNNRHFQDNQQYTSAPPAPIFKIKFKKRSDSMKRAIRVALQFDRNIKSDPFFSQIFDTTKNHPRICFGKGKNIQQHLIKAKLK